MRAYTIYYTVTYEGQCRVQAASEEEAREIVNTTNPGDLVDEADYTDVAIDDVEMDASPLEKIAEQAE